MPAEKKRGCLRVLRKDFLRPDGSAAAAFAVLANERDEGDLSALERVLARAIESSASAFGSDLGGKKKIAVDILLEHIARNVNAGLVREIDVGTLRGVPRVHAVLAVVAGSELALAGHGGVHAFLFRTEKRKMVPTDLLHLEHKNEKHPDARNFFGEFVSGSLRDADVVALGSNSLLDYVSLDHLGGIVSGTPHPEEAAEKIAHLLADTGGTVAFGEVILRSALAPVVRREPERPVKSIEAFLDAQKTTREYLKPKTFKFPKLKIPKISLPEIKVPRVMREVHHALLERLVERYNAFPRKAKILFPVVLFCVAIFFQSLTVVQKSMGNSRANRNFTQTLALVREKADEAQASMLYGNEDGARASLAEATALLAGLASPNAKQENDFISTRELVQSLSRELAHRKLVTESKTLATLPEDANGSLLLAILKGRALMLDQTTGALYRYEPASETVALNPILTLPGTEGGWTRIVFLEQSTALAISKNDVARVNLKEKKSTLFAVEPKTEVVDAAVWNKRLYRLGASGQIYRHDRSDAGYAKGVPWLKIAPVASAQALAIDSAIYLLMTDGTVKKYLSGREQSFSLPPLDEPLTSVSRLRTFPEAEVIAVLDPTAGRIVFVSASGKLMTQYESKDLLQGASDFAFDAENKTIYALSHKSLVSFPMQLK